MVGPSKVRRWLWFWALGYAIMLGIVATAMFKARDWAIAHLATPESAAEWEAWRADVRQQETNVGPVQRRVPNSSEPPALVLMRDHFAVSMFGALLFSSALYWVLAWFVIGVFRSR